MYRRTHMTKYTESKKKQLAKTRAFFKVCRKFIPRLKKYSKRMKYIGIGKTANSKHFASGLPQDKSVLKHFSIQPYTNVMADKFIFFLGEYHVNDAHAEIYNKELLRLFKELNKTKGVPHVHFFTKLGFYEDPKQHHIVYNQYKKSKCLELLLPVFNLFFIDISIKYKILNTISNTYDIQK